MSASWDRWQGDDSDGHPTEIQSRHLHRASTAPIPATPMPSIAHPPALVSGRGPQSVHRSDIFFASPEPRMRSMTLASSVHDSGPPPVPQLPQNLKVVRHNVPSTTIPPLVPERPFSSNQEVDLPRTTSSFPPIPPKPSYHSKLPPPLPPSPPQSPSLTQTTDERLPESASDELAVALALSQSESLKEQLYLEQLSTKEEDDLARALAESMLYVNDAQCSSPIVGTSSEASTSSKHISTNDSYYSMSTNGNTGIGRHDKWKIPGTIDDVSSSVHGNENPLSLSKGKSSSSAKESEALNNDTQKKDDGTSLPRPSTSFLASHPTCLKPGMPTDIRRATSDPGVRSNSKDNNLPDALKDASSQGETSDSASDKALALRLPAEEADVPSFLRNAQTLNMASVTSSTIFDTKSSPVEPPPYTLPSPQATNTTEPLLRPNSFSANSIANSSYERASVIGNTLTSSHLTSSSPSTDHDQLSPVGPPIVGSENGSSSLSKKNSIPNPDSGVPNLNHFIDSDLLFGVSIGFEPPVVGKLKPMEGAMPNIVTLPYGRCPPLHLQAPSWRHLLKLMARLSGSRIEPTVEAMAISKTDLKLRTVIQFIKPNVNEDWRTILWFTSDHPVPVAAPGAHKYNGQNVNMLPWSYTLSPTPMLLRDAADSLSSKAYTIPATDSIPYPSLPISFPNLALYLQASLDESRRYLNDGSSGYRKLARMLDTCYPTDEYPSESSGRGVFGRLGRVFNRGENSKQRKGGNEETYEMVTPFVSEWG